MFKWKLMLATLPWVAAAVVAKLVLELVIGYPGVVDFADVGLVLSGGVFLLGFMLAGTLADFKEAEKLPGELACTLETIEETFAQAALTTRDLDPAILRRRVFEVADGIVMWICGKITSDQIFIRLTTLGLACGSLEKAGATSYAGRALAEVHALRKAVTRLGVISRTGFISAGYALLETLAASIFVVLMISRFKSPLGAALLTAFVVLIFVYMLKLIRDIDDPFEYGEEGQQTGGAEVELFPLTEYRDRLAERLDATSLPPMMQKRAPAVPAPASASATVTTPITAKAPASSPAREATAATAQAALDGPASAS